MSRQQEFDIPDLGPAERGENGRARPQSKTPAADKAPPERAAGTRAEVPRRSGGYLLHSLVLVLLTAATSGLGYWGYGLQQQLEQSRDQLAKASSRLADLEQLMEVTSDSAAQSGQTLSERLEQQSKTADEKYRHFDSEIAKLWTIAYQRNKPKLEEQDKTLAAQQQLLTDQAKKLENQDKTLKAQAGKLDSLGKQLADQGQAQQRLDKQLGTLDGLDQQQTALKKSVQASIDDLKRSVAGLDTQVRANDEAQSARVASLQTALKKVDGQLASLEKGAAGGGNLAPRVRSNEQAIQAIDGSRRQMNQELLQIRKQLNNLQLQLQ